MTLKLKNRTIHESGLVEYSDDGLVDLLLSGNSLEIDNGLFNSSEVTLFNSWAEYFKLDRRIKSGTVDHAKNQQEWFLPEEYRTLDLETFFSSKCSTDEELSRVAEELILFRDRNMEPLLRFLIFLVDFMEERKIVYGVGRGSSVASFCLYLVGVHQINSLRYQIPISEFLR